MYKNVQDALRFSNIRIRGLSSILFELLSIIQWNNSIQIVQLNSILQFESLISLLNHSPFLLFNHCPNTRIFSINLEKYNHTPLIQERVLNLNLQKTPDAGSFLSHYY